MKRLLFSCSLLVIQLTALYGKPEATATWNLAQAFNASTHVFYGSLAKSIPEPNFKTGVMGVDVQQIDGTELPLVEIIWPKAKELSFTVTERFKGELKTDFIAFKADPHLHVWTHVTSEAGDVFLAQPDSADPLIEKLHPDDTGLFFIRHYLGSNIPIVYRVRLGQKAMDDLIHLRAHQAAGGKMSLEAIQKKARLEKLANAQREAEEFRVFEGDYYKILRIQDLDIRTSLLNDLIVRMGFVGRWTYQDFKDRYLQQYGAYIELNEVPSSPTDGKERIWKDISYELEKIEVILKARSQNR